MSEETHMPTTNEPDTDTGTGTGTGTEPRHPYAGVGEHGIIDGPVVTASVFTTPEGMFQVRVTDLVADESDNPRDFDGTFAVMVLSNRRYTLPREGDLVGKIDEVLGDTRYGATLMERFHTLAGWLKVEHDVSVVLPVWGYDHGELHLKAGDRVYPFNDQWDSGMAGVVYDNPDRTAENPHLTTEQITAELAGEVGQYSQWINNEVFGYAIDRWVDGAWQEEDTGRLYYSPQEALGQGKHEVPGYTEAVPQPATEEKGDQ